MPVKAWLPIVATLVLVGTGSHGSTEGAVAADGALGASRILYASDWGGSSHIFAVDPTRRRPTGQLTFDPVPACSKRPGVTCGYVAPEPSPDGRGVLFWDDHYGAREVTLYVARADGSHRRALARSVPTQGLAVPEAEWSPDSRRIAYRAQEWHVVGADGMGDRVASSPWIRSPGQSPDGRWVVTPQRVDLLLWDTERAIRRTFPFQVQDFAWSRNSRFLALATKEGIHVLDSQRSRVRRMTRHTGTDLAWSPDDLSVAFVETADRRSPEVGDLRVVTVEGRVRTVVDAAGNQGGLITDLAWTRPPNGTAYRHVLERFVTSKHELVVPWPVDRLAADGDRVAFASCNHVFVWTPSHGEVTQAESIASLSPRCSGGGNYLPVWTFDLALSGERVAWGELSGNAGRTARLESTTLGVERETVTLAVSHGAGGPYTWKGIGELAGSDGFLVFSSWVEEYSGGQCCAIFTAEQSIKRVDPRGCPCPVLRTEPGPLVPLDVDRGRIMAGGDNALLLLDSSGVELVSVAVRADAALLSGQDLVVLVRGGLRSYNASNGALLRTWPLPDVPSGQTCGSLNVSRCQTPELSLEDVARGLVTYVLDERVHVLRLADGADAVVARATLARFMDSGLVYADGSRLHLVPFDRLPLR
jgi:hypothetical protein